MWVPHKTKMNNGWAWLIEARRVSTERKRGQRTGARKRFEWMNYTNNQDRVHRELARKYNAHLALENAGGAGAAAKLQ